MSQKSSVSGLQEYCARYKCDFPDYEFIEKDDGYICRVELGNMEAHGNGRSKRDAKHLGALNMLKKLKQNTTGDYSTSVEISTVGSAQPLFEDEMTNANCDMLKVLRDFCVQNDHPLPLIEIVQQSGTPDAPEFTAVCKIATITRYATSDKKKDAKQKVAIKMLRLIINDVGSLEKNMQVIRITSAAEPNKVDEVETERRLKFKTYRELTDAGPNEMYGTLLCDRHNYFKNFFPHLKENALKVLRSNDYDSDKSRVLDLLQCLKITPKITTMPSLGCNEPLIAIDLNTELDCFFADLESRIYTYIAQYFDEMLS